MIGGRNRPIGMRARAAAVGKTAAVKQGRDIDERLGLAGAGRWLLNYIFPDHWSFMLGEIALYSFIILILTGVYVTFFFVDSAHEIVYHGAYLPLRGVHMSEAYASTLDLSFSVRAGLVIRQMHHWAAVIFIGAIGIHMCRIFFTGAFRKPREINWTIGLGLLTLALLNGFLGYSLPDDLVSGTGLRIFYSVFESIPLIGPWFVYLLYGGNFPGNAIIPHMLVLHVFVVPILIAVLLTAHLAIIMRQHHSQFPGKGATETNVVGTPMWPAYAAKSGGYFFMLFGVIAALGGVAQINPIWLFGPYDPIRVSSFTQPDWYIGWMDGALRLMPNWELHLPGHMVANAFWPALFMPGILFTVLGAWPFLEARLTRDYAHHNLLDRPRDRPVRTAIGAGLLTFFLVMLLGGSEDVIAVFLSTSVQAVVWTLRISLVVAPLIVGPVTYLLCKELSAVPSAGFRPRPNVIVRTADGGYEAVPAELHPLEQPEELHPAPVGEATVPEVVPGAQPELVGAGRAPRGPAPPVSAATAVAPSTAPSAIPGVRTVSREDAVEAEVEARRQRGFFGRRRSNGAGGDGPGRNGPDGDGPGGG
jgi:ubiquinol-cytochrome c reductase cytochrome b subunit